MNINWTASPEGGELRISQRINPSWPCPCVVHSRTEDVNINRCPLTEVSEGLCYHRDTGCEHTELVRAGFLEEGFIVGDINEK